MEERDYVKKRFFLGKYNSFRYSVSCTGDLLGDDGEEVPYGVERNGARIVKIFNDIF